MKANFRVRLVELWSFDDGAETELSPGIRKSFYSYCR